MDKFDGRDFNNDEAGTPIERNPEPVHDRDLHEAFGCPFCETPVNLATRPDEEHLVAECPSCESWFTIEEWRYYKLLVA